MCFNSFPWRNCKRVYWFCRFIIYVALLHSSSWPYRWNEHYNLVGFGGCYVYCEKSCEILTKKNYSFLSEEIGKIKNKDEENIWIIDPIDGTTNFLHGIPHFAICIALQSNNEIVSGLIFDPIKDEMFFAEKNKGSYLNNQRLRVSKKNVIDDCLFSSNHDGVRFSNFNMRYTGCAALDLAYVAAGRFDGFFHNDINIWDVAAGSLMVREAGGVVNDLNKFNYNAINIRASSDGINDKMIKELENF